MAAASFDGAVSDAYQRVFEANRPAFDAVVAAVRADLAALGATSAAGDGLRVLDLASGPGEPATSLARALPGAAVTCTDVAPAMVDKAKRRAASLPNVAFAVVDACDLSAFSDGAFDAVTCCYGVMFFPDAPRALAELARVLTPRGRAYVAFWKRLAIMEPLAGVMRDVTGAEPPPPPINPLRFAADGALEALLPAAGLECVGPPIDLRYDFDLGADLETAFMQGSIPIAAALTALEAAGQADARARARDAWAARLRAAGLVAPDGRFVLSGNVAHLLVLRAREQQ